jgi:nucleotide-binding universal stress UspA family protein
MTQFLKILVPVDFSDHSNAAQETAVEIAKTVGAKIWLLHCYQLHPGGVSPYGIAAPASYQDDVREAGMQRLRERQEKIEAAGVLAEASVSSEFPPQAIAEMAQGIGADL